MKLVTTKPVAKRAIALLFFVNSTLRNFILFSHLLRTPYLPGCTLDALFWPVLLDANWSGTIPMMMRRIPSLSSETPPTLLPPWKADAMASLFPEPLVTLILDPSAMTLALLERC
jgi:hypothetical protein